MIDKLEMLLALAREQHFGRAAEACGITQPTLSAGLKQLEDTLGVLLVNRQSRFIGFTPEGQRVLDWARRIVADSRAMRQELRALKDGLVGHLRLAAIPTALPIIAALTTPLRIKHPDLVFTALSRTSIDVLTLLENLEIDAGLTYIDNEPLGRVRIIDSRLREAGIEPQPTLQSNSMLVLFSHVRTGRWASVWPAVLAETLGLAPPIRSIPITEARPPPVVGLVYPQREPMAPATAALVTEARRFGQTVEPRR